MTKLVKVINIDDEYLQEIVDSCTMIDEKVKQKILEMLQTWGMAFRNQSKYRIVTVRYYYFLKCI